MKKRDKRRRRKKKKERKLILSSVGLFLLFFMLVFTVFCIDRVSDGFEEGIPGTFWTSVIQTGGANITQTSNQSHHGNYAANVTRNATGNAYVTKDFGPSIQYSTFYIRFALRMTELMDMGEFNRVLYVYNGSNRIFALDFNWDAPGQTIWFRWWYPAPGSNVIYDWDVKPNEWQIIQVGFYKHATEGFYRVWVEGELELDESRDTSSAPTVDRFLLGRTGGADWNTTFYLDCVVVDDEYIETCLPISITVQFVDAARIIISLFTVAYVFSLYYIIAIMKTVKKLKKVDHIFKLTVGMGILLVVILIFVQIITGWGF